MISTAGPPPKQGTNGVRGAQDPNDGCCDNAVGRIKEVYDRIPPCTSKSLIDKTVKVAAEGFRIVISRAASRGHLATQSDAVLPYYSSSPFPRRQLLKYLSST